MIYQYGSVSFSGDSCLEIRSPSFIYCRQSAKIGRIRECRCTVARNSGVLPIGSFSLDQTHERARSSYVLVRNERGRVWESQ